MQRDLVATEPSSIKGITVSDDTEELAASSQGGLNFQPLLRTIQRKALLILGIAGLTTTLAWRFGGETEPLYAGNFRMLVEPVTSADKLADPLTLTRTQGSPNDNLFEIDYPTQLEILKSEVILDEIIARVQQQYGSFQPEDLRKNLKVERLIGENRRYDTTKILEVRYEGKDPDLVRLVLEATKDRYLSYSLDERKNRISEGVKFIDKQLPELQQRVNQYQSQIQNLQQRYELINPQAQAEEVYQQIRDLENQRLATSRELQELQTQYRNLQAQLQLTPDEAIAASALSEDPNRSQLLSSLTEIENQIAQQSAIYNENTPEMRLLRQQRQNILNLLNQETGRILGENSASSNSNSSIFTYQNSIRQNLIAQMVQARNQIAALEVRLSQLTSTRQQLQIEAEQFPQISRQYTDFTQQLELTNQNLNRFLAQREKLRVESAQSNIPWEVLSPPQLQMNEFGEPDSVAEENTQKMIALGAMGGLALGILLAILLERIHNIFYTTEDLKDSIQLPLLGIIPRQKMQPSLNLFKLPGLADTTHGAHNYQSSFIDAFDSLYANIKFLYADTPIQSVAIASAEARDGKSTVALHLAQTIANMGQRVLVVDANLRHPQLHSSLGLANQKGLSDLLTTKLTPSAVIQRSLISENLFVLTSGTPTLAAIKLLGSGKMQHITQELQRSFDLVIYDTPELNQYTDTTFLCGLLDGLIMVVGVAKSHKSVVEQTLNQLNTFRLPCLGVVANHLKRRSASATPHLSEPTPVHKTEEIEQMI
ncbi:MAG: polysaccharide biosynthesis tyrosine autokinase [Microcoleaceae cyanobacterium]